VESRNAVGRVAHSNPQGGKGRNRGGSNFWRETDVRAQTKPALELNDLKRSDVLLPPRRGRDCGEGVVVVHDDVHKRVEHECDGLQRLGELEPVPAHEGDHSMVVDMQKVERLPLDDLEKRVNEFLKLAQIVNVCPEVNPTLCLPLHLFAEHPPHAIRSRSLEGLISSPTEHRRRKNAQQSVVRAQRQLQQPVGESFCLFA